RRAAGAGGRCPGLAVNPPPAAQLPAEAHDPEMPPALPPELRAAVPGPSCAAPQVLPGAAFAPLAPVTTIVQTAAATATLTAAERHEPCIIAQPPGVSCGQASQATPTLTQFPGDGKARGHRDGMPRTPG